MEKNSDEILHERTIIKLYRWVPQHDDHSGNYSDPETHYLPISPFATGVSFERAAQEAYYDGLDLPFDYTAHSDGSYSVYIAEGTDPYGLRWWVEHTGSALRPLADPTPPVAHTPSAAPALTPYNTRTSTQATHPATESHITVRYLAPNGLIVQKSYTSTQTVNEIIRTLRSSRSRTLLSTLNKVEEHMFQEGVILHFNDRIPSETLNDALGETLTPIS